MLNTFIRAMILYLLVLVSMRLMGKREIGQFQPFELAIAIMISDLASNPISDIGIPLTDGIIPIIGLLLLHLIITLINLSNGKLRSLICGKPSILIHKGKIDEQQLKKEKFSITELEAKLRNENIMNIKDVEYAILETNGNISVILKKEKEPLTLGDINLSSKYTGLTYNLVIDGEVSYENLKRLNKNYSWLETIASQFHISPQEALILSINEAGEVYCQKKEGNAPKS